MTIGVIPERLHEIQLLLQTWLCKETASLEEIQSLLGKLNFYSSVCKTWQIFFQDK